MAIRGCRVDHLHALVLLPLLSYLPTETSEIHQLTSFQLDRLPQLDTRGWRIDLGYYLLGNKCFNWQRVSKSVLGVQWMGSLETSRILDGYSRWSSTH